MAEISKNILAVLMLLIIIVSIVSTYLVVTGGNVSSLGKPDYGTGTVRLNIVDQPPVVDESDEIG